MNSAPYASIASEVRSFPYPDLQHHPRDWDVLSLHCSTFNVASSSFEFISTCLQKSCCLSGSTAINWIGPVWVLPVFSHPTYNFLNGHQAIVPEMPMTAVHHLLGQASMSHWVKLKAWRQCSQPSPASPHTDPHSASCLSRVFWVKSNRLNVKLILPLTVSVNVLSLRFLIQ